MQATQLLKGMTRAVVRKTIGRTGMERILTWIFRQADIDMVRLGYRNIGVLNWEDLSVSGEKPLIDQVSEDAIWSDRPVFFDVGANIGSYSKALVETFPEADIYAFEPNPVTFRVLKEGLNGHEVTCIPGGLGSVAGEGTLHVYPDDLINGHASQCEKVFTDLRGCAEPKEFPFTIMTVDRFCEERGIERIDLLKIDTEGFELDVLKGGRRMLEEHRIGMIQFEFGDCDIFTRVFLKDFYNTLPDYRLYRVNTGGLVPLGEYTPVNEIFLFQNILAVHKDLPFPAEGDGGMPGI